MSGRTSRPYNNYNNKNRRSNKNYNNKKKKKPQKDNLENTTRIRIDDDRINDIDSLDTSFLEGRLDKKVKKNKKAKEKILVEKKKTRIKWGLIGRILIIFFSMFLIVLAVILVINNKEKFIKEKKINKTVKEEVVKVNIDNNYLFVGDRYTDDLNFDDLDYHYVKVSEDDLKLEDVLDNMKDKIYRYNPTIVFIELGFVDLQDERKHEDIVADLEKVVDGIKKNRPYAKIYIESLYPVNKDVEDYDDEDLREDFDNDEIKDFNKLISKMTKSKKINYLDIFSLLEKDGKLDEKYTDDGVRLNDEGNAKILEKIEKIVG